MRIDAAGNLRGLYAGAESKAPRLLVGSHLDTVPNAGAYDGVLGVVLAVALLQALDGRRMPFAIEVIGFSEEEGVRFGTPFIGSRALTGRLDEKLLARTDPRGISVRKAIEEFGLNPREIPLAALGRRYSGLCGISHRARPGSGSAETAAGSGGCDRRPEPVGVHIRWTGQPRRYDADASALRCDRGRSGVDHGGGAGSEQDFQGWSPRWAQSRRSLAPLTSLRGRLG